MWEEPDTLKTIMDKENELKRLTEAVRAAQRELAEERRKNQEAEETLEMLKAMTMAVCREIHYVDWNIAKADFILDYQRTKHREFLERMERAKKAMEETGAAYTSRQMLINLIETEKRKVRENEEKDILIAKKMKELKDYMESIDTPEERESFRKEKIEKLEKKLAAIREFDDEFKRIKAHAESINIDDLFR